MDKLLIMNFINLINYRIMTIAHCVTNIITKKKKIILVIIKIMIIIILLLVKISMVLSHFSVIKTLKLYNAYFILEHLDWLSHFGKH